MKKVVLSLLVFIFAGAMTWADMAASVYMVGDAFGTEGTLQFSFNGKNTGAAFKFWTNPASDTTVKIRSVSLWYKPVENLKVTIGGVGAYTYTEGLDWWKTPTGASYAQYQGWDTRWSNAVTYSDGNAGVQIEGTPVENLFLTAGVAPGYDNKLFSSGSWDDSNLQYGASAKYDIKGFGSVSAAFRNDGTYNEKIVRAGADFNAIDHLYSFVNVITRFDNTSAAWGSSKDALKLAGVSVDFYAAYSIDALSIKAQVPVTFRLTGDAGDDSYTGYDLKVAYAIAGTNFTPYARIQEKGDVQVLFTNPKFLPQINVGTDIGGWDGGSFTISYQYTIGETTNTWAIPFEARVSF